MLKIDVNKSGRIFDFLVSAGMLLLSYDPLVKHVPLPVKDVNGAYGGHLSVEMANGQSTPHSAQSGMTNGTHHSAISLGPLVNGQA